MARAPEPRTVPPAPGDAGPVVSPWPRRLVVTAIFAVAEIVMVRRTPSQLAGRVLGNLGDPALVIWTFRWDGHALLHHPLSLFNAPIFWPYPHTLAYADDLISIAPFYNALYALTHNWALSLNLLWLGELGLLMGATYSLCRWLTGRAEAAVFAGLAAGFSAFVWSQTGHPQLEVVGLVPLGMLGVFKLLERPSIGRALAVGAVNLVILLAASYWALAYAVAVVVVLVLWLVATRARGGKPALFALGVAGAITLVALPTFLPYRQVERIQGPRALAPQWSMRPRDVIRAAPGSYLYQRLARDTGPGAGERHLFPGFLTIALALVGAASLALGFRRHGAGRAEAGGPAPPPDRRRFTAMLVAAGLVLAVMAAGSNTHGIPTPWNVLYDYVPGFSGIRVTARLAEVTLIVGAVLAGVGLDAILPRLPYAGARLAVAAVAGIVVLAELAGPLAWVPIPGDRATLAVYQALRSRPSGAVAELPIADPTTETDRWSYTEPPRMVWSTIDWHPRLNGYSGYLSPTYPADTEALASLPSRAALARLRERRVRYLVLHTGEQAGYPMFTEAEAQAILAGLPATAQVDRYGPNYLVDLGPA